MQGCIARPMGIRSAIIRGCWGLVEQAANLLRQLQLNFIQNYNSCGALKLGFRRLANFDILAGCQGVIDVLRRKPLASRIQAENAQEVRRSGAEVWIEVDDFHTIPFHVDSALSLAGVRF